MFSGIVETTTRVLSAASGAQLLTLEVLRPDQFDDLKPGDSVCVDGVCLTIEKVSPTVMQFALAAETLHVTGWTAEWFVERSLNVERSLRFGERIHGHLVSGHVEAKAKVIAIEPLGSARRIRLAVDDKLAPLIFDKGSVALNGVSLTINGVEGTSFDVCLIPETLARTNLSELRAGDVVNFEADAMTKAVMRILEAKQAGGVR